MELDARRKIVQHAIEVALDRSAAWRACSDLEFKKSVIRKIERSCCNEAVHTCKNDGIDRMWSCEGFISRYSMYAARIIDNIYIDLDGGYNYFIASLLSKSINIDEIAKIDSKLLIPAASAYEREIVEIRMNQKIERVVSKMYKCSKCGMNETTLREYQAACADEGSKYSITCINCGNRWRTY